MAGQGNIIVAVMGAGAQGLATLTALLEAPDVEVRYVVDPDPRAPGIAVAREHGIRCETHAGAVTDDAEVDLILETGGDRSIRADLEPGARPDGRLLGTAGTRLVAGLVAEIAAVEESARAEKARYLRQASHQVKSPLTAIQSSVNVILGGYTGEIPERTRETVQKIHARCRGGPRRAGQAAAARRPALRRPRRARLRDRLRDRSAPGGGRPPRRRRRRARHRAPGAARHRARPRALRARAPRGALLGAGGERGGLLERRRQRGGVTPRYGRTAGWPSPSATTASASPSAASRRSSTRTTGPMSR